MCTQIRAGALTLCVGALGFILSPSSSVATVPDNAAVYEELLEVTGVFAAARTSAQGVVDRLRAENPVVPEAVWTSFAAKVADRDNLAPLYVPVYSRHLSAADAQALLDFYRSTPGTRWLEALPKIQQACRADAEQWAHDVLAEVMAGRTASERGRAPRAVTGVDRRRVERVHELLRASGALVQARRSMTLMLDRLQQGPFAGELTDSFWTQVRERLSDEGALLNLWTPAYLRYLTDDDIRSLIALYRSAPGERYVAALPAIQRESLDAATQLANASARRAVREVLGPLPQWRLQHPAPTDHPER